MSLAAIQDCTHLCTSVRACLTDFGLQPLSNVHVALQIWVPPVQDATELGAILDARLTGDHRPSFQPSMQLSWLVSTTCMQTAGQSLTIAMYDTAGPAAEQGFGNKLLQFWMFFREQAGAARTALSIRDLLAWVSGT